MRAIHILFLLMLLGIQSLFAFNVSGLVFNSKTNLPVDHAQVIFKDTVSGEVSITNTKDDGKYSIDLAAGFYRVHVVAALYNSEHFGPYNISIETQNLNFGIEKRSFGVDNLVSGTVKDANTQLPISNASVSLYLWGIQIHKFTTGSNGKYSFEDIMKGDYFLKCSANGYAVFTDNIEVEQNSLITFDIALTPGSSDNLYSISGIVKNKETGSPLADANISMVGIGSIFFEQTTSDASGNYSFAGLKGNRDYFLTTHIDEYFPSMEKVSVDNQNVVFDISLRPIHSSIVGYISGKITDDDGNPINGVRLEFIPVDNFFHFNKTSTYTDGTYKVSLSPGSYYVKAFLANSDFLYRYSYKYFDNVTNIEDAKSITVVENQTVENINFNFNTSNNFTTTVSGYVKDQDNQPLKDALVSVLILDRPIMGLVNEYNTFTDQDGKYSVTFNVPELNNKFKVSAVKLGYYPEYYNEKDNYFDATVLEATNNSNFSDIGFTLKSVGTVNHLTISGRVTNELGEPILKSAVIVQGVKHNSFNITSTDEDGYYSVNGLRDTSYYIYFVAKDYIPEYYDDAKNWESAQKIQLTTDRSDINATLEPVSFINMPGVVTGTINNSQNQVLAGVTVKALNADGDVTGYSLTDENGNYRIDGLNSGSFTISASTIEYGSQSKSLDIDLSTSITNSANFTLSPSSTTGTDKIKTPTDFALSQNYPNPFNPSTQIKFTLPSNSAVKLKVYNLIGEVVKELVNSNLSAGTYTIDFRAENLSSGIYFYRLEAGNTVQTKKMTLLK